MKEIMIPYVLLMLVLVSTNAIKWNLKSAFWISFMIASPFFRWKYDYL